MKSLTLALLLMTFFSCTQRSTQESNTATQTTFEIDIKTTDGFIESVQKYLLASSDMKDYSGYEVNGKLVFDNNAGFKIFSFTQTFDEYKYNTAFSIVLNAVGAGHDIANSSNVLSLVDELLKPSGLTYALYVGEFVPSLDFQQDGSTDFILEDEHLYRDNFVSHKQVVLYNGKNELFSTQIIAASDYTQTFIEEGTEGLSGIKSEMTITSGNLPEILVRKQENVTVGNSAGDNMGIPLDYTLSWQWHNAKNPEESEWKTAVKVNYEKSIDLMSSLTKKRTKLTEAIDEEYGYAVVENCQNGGTDFLFFEKYQEGNNMYYIKQDNYDDVGSYIAFSATDRGNESMVVILARVEKFDWNKTGHPEISGAETTKLFIRKFLSTYDLQVELIKFEIDDTGFEFVYTFEPESYTYIECNFSHMEEAQ